MGMSCIRRISIADNGVTYNSYLILGEKTALIDTVPQNCADRFVKRLIELLGGRKLDYVILNHTECDRSGALGAVIESFGDVEIISTIAGLKNIAEQLNRDFRQSVAKSGGELRLGENITVKFLITHNINWPDSMMSYLCEEKALFSCDAFSDEGNGIEAYYSKNLAYLKEYVKRATELIKELDVDRILPGIGEEVKNPSDAIKSYAAWSKPDTCDTVTVIYESKSQNTKAAAEIAYGIIKAQGFEARLLDAAKCGKTEAEECIYTSVGVIFGSPTVCRNIPKELLSIITEMNHYRIGKTKFAAFGSYGWSGEAPNLIYTYLRARHFQTVGAPYRFLFCMSDSEKEGFEKYILNFCEQIKADR